MTTPGPPPPKGLAEPIPRRFRGGISPANLQTKRNDALDILQGNADVMGNVITMLESLEVFLRLQQSILVSTVDTLVYEHITVEIPAGGKSFSLTVPPQTRQLEQIDTVFTAITFPAINGKAIGTAPTVTLDNAYAQLGDDYVNLYAILNSAAGTGGVIPTPLAILLNHNDERTFNIHATEDFVPGLFMTAILTGHTIPATLGEANV